MAAEARALTLRIQSAVQERWPSQVRLWPTPNWPLTLPNGQRVRPPRTGVSDLQGLGPNGVHISLEIKTPNDRLSKEQESFGRMVKAFGGIFIVARSAEQVVTDLAAELERRAPHASDS